jgi:hypothetical protein
VGKLLLITNDNSSNFAIRNVHHKKIHRRVVILFIPASDNGRGRFTISGEADSVSRSSLLHHFVQKTLDPPSLLRCPTPSASEVSYR